jgi:hypothetical protein
MKDNVLCNGNHNNPRHIYGHTRITLDKEEKLRKRITGGLTNKTDQNKDNQGIVMTHGYNGNIKDMTRKTSIINSYWFCLYPPIFIPKGTHSSIKRYLNGFIKRILRSTIRTTKHLLNNHIWQSGKLGHILVY